MTKLNRGVWVVAAGIGMGLVALTSSFASGSAASRDPAPVRIATVDVLGLVERFLASDRYAPAQKSFLDAENEKLRPAADELDALQRRASTLLKDSPDLDQLGRDYDQKRQAFDQARQEAFARIETYNTDQVREAYRLILQAADDLATKSGYTQVIASRTGPVAIRSTNVPGALQEILARPVVKSDPADDLTDRLIKQFKLESVKLDDQPGQSPRPTTPARNPLPPTR